MNRLYATMLVWLTMMSASASAYTEPRDTTPIDPERWTAFTAPLTFSWASKDVHYPQFAAPDIRVASDTLVHAWRGERLGVEALIVATEPTKGKLRPVLSPFTAPDGVLTEFPGSCARFMRYVVTNRYRQCGALPDGLPAYTVPDMIDKDNALEIEAKSVRPVWCTVEIPRDAVPGPYTATLSLIDDSTGKAAATLRLTVEVSARTLPEPSQQSFYLDLWQQPYSVSRYHDVPRWSDEHFELLRPYAEYLGRAGQKTVSAILFYEPWGEQSNDKFDPMIQTVRHADGSWSYDYTIFDRYVEFMGQYGIDANIECFTMIPWEMKFRYLDEPSGEYRFLEAGTTTPEYHELWTSFLRSFASHLRDKGWYDKTMIGIDERGLRDILNAYAIAQEAVPGIKMSLAGNYHPELVDKLACYTLMIGDFFPEDVLAQRKADGQVSLLYTCCASPAPNMFSNSEPADNAYLPIYSTQAGFDGFLHWSFMNWTDHPLTDTRFKLFAPGDTYFIYPEGRSSIRYERMVEGIQMSEKLQMLQEEMLAKGDIQGYAALQKSLLPLRTKAMTRNIPTSQIVNNLNRAIDSL